MILTVVLLWTPDSAVTLKMLGTLIPFLESVTGSFTLDVGEMRIDTEARRNVSRDADT